MRAASIYVVGGWAALQLAALVLPAWGIPDNAMRYVFAALFLGFVPALVFAWHFDVGTGGVRRAPPAGDAPVDLSLGVTDYVLLGLLAAVATAITFGAGIKVVGTPSAGVPPPFRDAPPNSIAVLPFVNVSDDETNEYFSDGMSEEVLSLLARVPGLQVAARTSSFSFKGSDTDVATIGGRLGVRHLLEGSVRKQGSRVRISAHLINSQTGYQLWSDSFDRQFDDIFTIQDEIAAAIVAALQDHLRGEDLDAVNRPQQPTRDMAAYELYLQGLYLWQQRGEDNLRRSVALFEQAIERDPSFALAHAGLAAVYSVLIFWTSGTDRDFGRLAEEAARAALALDSDNAKAHAVLAGRLAARRQWTEAESSYRRAMALEPSNESAPHWFADFLQQVGRVTESARMAERALRIDPVSPVRNIVAAVSHLYANEPHRAREHRDIAYRLGLAQDDFLPLLFALHERRYADAHTFLEQGSRRGDDLAWLAAVLGGLEQPEQAEGGRTALRAAFAADALPEHQAFLLAIHLGDLDFAMERGEGLARESSWFMSAFWIEQAAPLRRDARFGPLMHEIGLVDYWHTNGWPDACQPAMGGGLDCR